MISLGKSIVESLCKFLIMRFYLLILCCTILTKANGQKQVKLSGTLGKFKSGKVFLAPIIDDANYYSDYRALSSPVIDGQFSFDRKVSDSVPQAYFLIYINDTLRLETGMMLLEAKDQNVFVDSLNLYVYPRVQDSKEQKELIDDYSKIFQSIVRRSNQYYSQLDRISLKYKNEIPTDSLLEMRYVKESISRDADSIFSLYIEKHRESYVSIWKLIDRVKLLGYKSRYEIDFMGLDASVRESRIGQALVTEMAKLKVLSRGSVFPEMNIQTIDKKSAFSISGYRGKLVLVEFWFHNCGPCIAQFGSLQNLYRKYKKEDFEIVAISTDKSADLMKLSSVLADKKYSWLNLWDENGKYATSFLINSFPTNYLVNESGVIVDVNVPPYLVEQYIRDFISKRIYFSNPYEPK